MTEFFKKHSARLKSIALILMLVLPCFLYQAAKIDSTLLLNFFFGLMIMNMLFVMHKG